MFGKRIGRSFGIGTFGLGALLWAAMFCIGEAGYCGSKFVYALFSLVTTIMLVTGLRQQASYGYLYLTVFLSLGFWLKLTLHTTLNYPFVEPVGKFAGEPEAWDEVVTTATVAFLGVVLGYFLFRRLIRTGNTLSAPVVPRWYPKMRKWLWTGILLTVVAISVLNISFGMHQIGLMPRTILMWPLNAIVSWMLNIGMATGIAVLLWWDVSLRRNITWSIYSILIEALLSSVSIMSRAVYVFHAIPQLWVLHRLKARLLHWSHTKTILVTGLCVLTLIVSISTVTTFRNYLYQSDVYSSTAYQVAYSRLEVIVGTIGTVEVMLKTAVGEERPRLLERLRVLNIERLRYQKIMNEEKTKMIAAMKPGTSQATVLLHEFGYQISDGFTTRILQLTADRWIGLEGVMAVESYPEKNIDLLFDALTSKQKASKADIYQTISQSIYLDTRDAKFRFRTLPGAVGFLYYSNSMWVVLTGMSLFTIIALGIESIIRVLTVNPIICSLYGAEFANNVAQFGGTPIQNTPYFLMLSCGILLVWAVRTQSLTRAWKRLQVLSRTDFRKK